MTHKLLLNHVALSYSGPYIFSSLMRYTQLGATYGLLGPMASTRQLLSAKSRLLVYHMDISIYHFTMSTHCSSGLDSQDLLALIPIHHLFSGCLYSCVLQSLCLHSWNTWLCQGSLYNMCLYICKIMWK